MTDDQDRARSIRKRLKYTQQEADRAGITLEEWQGDGHRPQRFTSTSHPGQALTLADLRDRPENRNTWTILLPSYVSPPTFTDALTAAVNAARDAA